MTKVLWFTGFSGSGKTTIATKLKDRLEKQGKKVRIFDGDDVRNTLHRHLGFTPQDIMENNRLIAELCLKHSSDYDYILVPIISPFKESRKMARELLKGGFIEVHVNCHLKKCIERDVKGHYKKALAGEIKNFIGIAKENPYEPPENPEIILDTFRETPSESVERLIKFLNSKSS